MAVAHLALEAAEHYLWQVEVEHVLLQVVPEDPFQAEEAHFGFIIIKLMVTIFLLLCLKSLFVLLMRSSEVFGHLFKFLCQCIEVYLLWLPSAYLIA